MSIVVVRAHLLQIISSTSFFQIVTKNNNIPEEHVIKSTTVSSSLPFGNIFFINASSAFFFVSPDCNIYAINSKAHITPEIANIRKNMPKL